MYGYPPRFKIFAIAVGKRESSLEDMVGLPRKKVIERRTVGDTLEQIDHSHGTFPFQHRFVT